MADSTGRPSVLDNPHAERVKRVAGLAGRPARQRQGLLLVEGPQAVRELLLHRAGDVRDVYLDEEALSRHPDIARAARAATRWVRTVTGDVGRALSRDAQGVVAVARAEAVVDGAIPAAGLPWPGRVWAPSSPGPHGGAELVVLLADARDPGNAGTVVRTADAMGADGVVLTRGSVDPHAPKVIRSSAGSVFHLPLVTGVDLSEAVEALHARGCVVVGTSGRDGSLDLSDLLDDALTGRPSLLGGPHAWVMGNEARGLSAEQEDLCDVLVRVPMTGAAESLNLAAAAAMCLFASQHARTAAAR